MKYVRYFMNQILMIATLPWFISANDSVHTPKCFEGYTDCIYFCDTDYDCKGNNWCTNETRRELDTCILPLYNNTDIAYNPNFLFLEKRITKIDYYILFFVFLSHVTIFYKNV